MTKSGKGRFVFVTGAGAGIGRATVQRLHHDGYRVLAGVRSAASADNLADGVQRVTVDITDDAQIANAAAQIHDVVGDIGLHALVNSAGVVVDGPLELTPTVEMRRQLEVNVIGRFAIARALLPALRRGRGRIVNIGAVSAHVTAPFFGCPAIASTAFAALNDAMRMEFAPFGIHVALIEPGAMRTKIFDKAARAQTAALESQPTELVDAYKPALDAVRASFDRSPQDDPAIVVDAIVRTLLTRGKPRARMLVGRGAHFLALVGSLPRLLRDPLLMRAMGLSRPMAKAAKTLRNSNR